MKMTEIFTKSAFARRVGVTKARVSQWLRAKQIGPRCLVGAGRNARINVEMALEDLRLKLDPTQRLGLNGLSTNLHWEEAPTAADNLDWLDPQPEDQRRERSKALLNAVVAQDLETFGAPSTDFERRTQAARVTAEVLRLFDKTMIELAGDLVADGNERDNILKLFRMVYSDMRDVAELDVPERGARLPSRGSE